MIRQRRRGKPQAGAVLAVVAIILPVLLGMVGLVIDSGLLMAAHRQARNAADAGALAAARDLLAGRSASVATNSATTYVRQHNGVAGAEVSVNIPPSSGPHAGNWEYAEVLVSRPSPTIFIQVLGINRNQSVVGRSVAGYRPIRSPARVVALNPNSRPGIDVGGGGSMIVSGPVAVNSEGGGVDQFSMPVANGNSGVAASVSNNSTFRATSLRTVGGVNNPANFHHFDTTLTGTPLQANSVPQPDPFAYLPPPHGGQWSRSDGSRLGQRLRKCQHNSATRRLLILESQQRDRHARSWDLHHSRRCVDDHRTKCRRGRRDVLSDRQ